MTGTDTTKKGVTKPGRGMPVPIVGALLIALLLGIFILFPIEPIDEPFPIEPIEPRGYIQTTRAYASGWVTVSSTAVVITDTLFGWAATDVSTAEKAYVSALGADVLVLWDGTVPTATLGMPLVVSTTAVFVGGDNIANLRFLRAGSDDAVVSVVLEK